VKSAKQALFGCQLVAATFLMALPSGCSQEKAAKIPEVQPATAYFPIKVGDRIVRMQIAATSGEMERGLMGRRELTTDEGMIFIFPKTQRASFWMRNTLVPLDIGYFTDDGVLREFYPMYPLDETAVQSKNEHIKYCLEMAQNWFAQNGVKPGAQLDLPALLAAVKARGFEPRNLGMVDSQRK
jgi:uncharacterized protein